MGEIADCRLRCDELIARCPEATGLVHELRAKAFLMRARTFYREREFDSCLTALDSLIETHSDCLPQLGMALLFRGYALSALGRTDPQNFELADQCYQLLENQILSHEDLYRSGVVQRRAALARAFNANAAGDETAMIEFANRVIELWPDSSEASDARTLLESRRQRQEISDGLQGEVQP